VLFRSARHFEIQTELRRTAGGTAGETNVITTFLQWFRRY
jgi:hypothetical protein